MHSTDAFGYGPELPAHCDEIEALHAEAFGPGRVARAAFRIREGGPHEPELSHVAIHTIDGVIAGSVRQTQIAVGEAGRALLLGPLAVRPAYKNLGVGRKLLGIAVDSARSAGHGAIILVGDAPYYAPFGFKPLAPGQVVFPGPVDPRRVLACPLDGGEVVLAGTIRHADLA